MLTRVGRPLWTRLVTVIANALVASIAGAGPVTGTVKTVTRSATGPAPAVVYAEPLDAPATRATTRLVLGQKNKAFQPRILAAPLGATIEFPNRDPIYHNVFSLSGPQPFDLGLYRAGDSRSRTFTAPGTYRVFCNIHPQMTAIVVVAPSGHTTLTDADGRFTLDLPAGRYRLTVLSERAPAVSIEIAAAAGASSLPEITLDESAWVFAQHKNKFGKDYPAAAYQR